MKRLAAGVARWSVVVVECCCLNELLVDNGASVVGTHESVTPVTLVCSRSELGRKTVFCRRTCPRTELLCRSGERNGHQREMPCAGNLEKGLEDSSSPVTEAI